MPKQKRKHKLRPKRQGFTLIELLVVISIIALLSSFVLVSVKAARDKALDVKRYAEISTLQKANELYSQESSGFGHYIFIPSYFTDVYTSDNATWQTLMTNQLYFYNYIRGSVTSVGVSSSGGVTTGEYVYIAPRNNTDFFLVTISNKGSSRQVCGRNGSYLFGVWMNAPESYINTNSQAIVFGKTYGFNYAAYGGNVEDPFVSASCP